MTGSAKAKIASMTVAVVCLAVAAPVQMRIDEVRKDLVAEHVMPTQDMLPAATSAVLGGFRGIAVDILWIQADAKINKKQFYQLKTYYELIATLQPNFASVWEFNMWNLAYNISAEWGHPEEKWEWIRQGINFGKKGLKYNPDSPGLHRWVGWLYYSKVNKDPYFVRMLREEEGIEPYKESYGYFVKAGELARAVGDPDILERRLASRAIFEHGKAVWLEKRVLGEALDAFSVAEKGARDLLAELPNDLSAQNLLDEVRAARAALMRRQ